MANETVELYYKGKPINPNRDLPTRTYAEAQAEGLTSSDKLWVRKDGDGTIITADQVPYDSNNSVKDKIDSVNARLVSTYLTYDSTSQRFKFQSGVPYPAILQLCLVGRNTSNGAIYVVWYNATDHDCLLGAVISGNQPANGQNINVQYLTTE